MAVTLTTSARNAAADAVVDSIDAGAGAGNLKIYTASLATLLATLPLSDPACGDAAAGVATFNPITSASAVATGTAAEFTIEDSDTNEVLRGSVGTSGEDINLNTVSITAGVQVSVTSFTYTQPAA